MENEQSSGTGKIIMIVLIVLITTAVLLGIGYYIGQKTKTANNLKKTATTTATTVASKTQSSFVPSPESSTTNNWKTYVSSQNNYSVKYPSSWVADDKDKTALSFYTTANMEEKNRLEAQEFGSEGPLSEALVVFYANLADADGSNPPRYSSLDEMVNDTTIYRDTTKTTFAGQQAYQTIQIGMVDFFEYILEKDGHIYVIMIPNKTSKAELDSTEQSFLSSFEFTN